MSSSIPTPGPTPRPTPYHHGDLRNALIRASADLAGRGGPEAVTIRAAARAVGVTPTAAYRHFGGQDDLLGAAKAAAQDALVAAMQHYLDRLPPQDDPVQGAMQRLLAIGRGYVGFATSEPGLFRTAFCTTSGDQAAGSGPSTEPGSPFGTLVETLDELVRVGYLDPAHRPTAEITAWATVHGLSSLLVDGPLHADEATRTAYVERAVELVARGLATGPNAPR
jgi:AcrR family transcriptional regulator